MLAQENGSAHRRLTKNEKRRSKKKSQPRDEPANKSDTAANGHAALSGENEFPNGIEVEYVGLDVENHVDDPLLAQFRDVFKKFLRPEELTLAITAKSEATAQGNGSREDEGVSSEEQTPSVELVSTEQKPLSKKKKKLLSRLSVAELKQLVPRPDVVEAHDVSSLDPRLLVWLKALRNTVPVPRHWCHIRKYLQGKRGIEKIPFQLPEFIAETGIAKIRETVLEAEALKKSKQRARERVRPKMGKIDIDYQVLHDAFFKYQTKPKLSMHGDLYYEGKEFEVQLKEKKAGVLSAELRAALGMADGTPPPWLVNMQRYGPPPSYSHLRIPGLNAPLPPGAAYGYQPGGWGKPPVDEYGRPLYGDVFGTSSEQVELEEEVDKTTRWGTFEIEVEEEEEEEEEEEQEVDEEGFKSGLTTPSMAEGTASLVAGMETPDTIDLRKRAGMETPESSYAAPRELYQVVPERRPVGGAAAAGQLFGSDRTYALPSKGDVTMALDPDQLEEMLGDKGRMKDAYDAQLAQAQNAVPRDGIETEEDASRGSRKRKADLGNTMLRKVKEFKF